MNYVAIKIYINIHNYCFNEIEFNNVRYRACHMTKCFMRTARLLNVDFIFVNLKNTSFKSSRFCKVVFNGCNLKDVDFYHVCDSTYFLVLLILFTSIFNSPIIDI